MSRCERQNRFAMAQMPMNTSDYNGVQMDRERYDDAIALRAYVFRHFPHLLTALERRVTEYDVPIVSNSDHWKIVRLHQSLEERDGHVPDEAVLAAMETPYDVRKQQALHRLISEKREQIFENRCPACERLARTPVAQQCLWCGYDWHRSGAKSPKEPRDGND